MKILKNLFGKNDTKIDANEVAVTNGNAAELLGNAVIVESGSNENGRYIKFGDGTMICTLTKEFDMNSLAFQYAYFPERFIGVPNCGVSFSNNSIGGSAGNGSYWNNLHQVVIVSESNIRAAILVRNPMDAEGISYITAIGRWK